jgi:two-component system phosphate regulon response regulator OmpR
MQPHVLFVDDEPPIREMLALFFRKKGYQVTTATTAAEGRQLLEAGTFDLAILDVDLAGQNGLELLALAKALHPELPVVMFTGMGYDPALLKQALKLGANGYMAKTEPLGDLFAVVDKLIHTA